MISISFSFIQGESDEPELESVAVGLLTVIISDHATVKSPVHYHSVSISVIIESDAMVSLPRLGDAFLVIFVACACAKAAGCRLRCSSL